MYRNNTVILIEITAIVYSSFSLPVSSTNFIYSSGSITVIARRVERYGSISESHDGSLRGERIIERHLRLE